MPLEEAHQKHRRWATRTAHEPPNVESIYQQPMVKPVPRDPNTKFRWQPAPARRETVCFDRDPAMVLFDHYRGSGLGNGSHCNNYGGYQVQWVAERAETLDPNPSSGVPVDPMPPHIPDPLLPEVVRPEPPKEPPQPPPPPRRRVKKKKSKPSEPEPEVAAEPEAPVPPPWEPTGRATDVIIVIERRLGEQAARASSARENYRRKMAAEGPGGGPGAARPAF